MQQIQRSLYYVVLAALFVSLIGEKAIAADPVGVRFGINSHLGETGKDELRGPETIRPTAADRTRYLDLVRELGVTTIRDDWGWAGFEPEQGKGYRFAEHDDLVRKASERDIDVVAMVYAFPEWATGAKLAPPDAPTVIMLQLPQRQFEPDFRRFVRALVIRYSGRRPESLPLKRPIRTWIFANEVDWAKPDLPNTSPDEYAFWLKAFYEEVKAIDPDAKVVTMGLGNPTADSFLPKFLSSKNLEGPNYPYFDVLNYHIYPGANVTSLSGIDDVHALFGRRLQEHKIKADLWTMEAGSFITDVNAQVDAQIKAVIHAASVGVHRVHLHCLWDISGYSGGVVAGAPSGKAPARKPLFAAYQTLIRMIGKNEGVQLLSQNCYRVRLPRGRSVYVAWSDTPANNKLGILKGRVRTTSLQGKQQETDVDELVLDTHPVFVELLDTEGK
jgi:hypothetical protein